MVTVRYLATSTLHHTSISIILLIASAVLCQDHTNDSQIPSHYKMTRQRPSSPARRLLDLNPSSEVRLHTAHGNGRSMYPGMQPRVSDDEDYELSRRPRTGYSDIVESGRNPYLSDVGDSNSYFGSRAGRSIPSQASFSDRSLEPSDSASNQGSNSPDDEYVPRNRHPHGYSNSHGRDAADGYHDSRRGPNTAESGSHVRTGLDNPAVVVYTLMNTITEPKSTSRPWSRQKRALPVP